MTEDFKQNLTNYLVNNVTKTEPTPKTRFDYVEIQNYVNTTNFPWGKLLPEDYDQLKLEGSITDAFSDKVVAYGSYRKSSTTKGIILVMDGMFNLIKVFTSYSNGTELEPIQCMKQAEDGTYYLTDKTTNLRFVMLNNFTQINSNGEYVLDFRKSYNFDSSFNNYIVKDMFKSGSSAHYVFFSEYETSIKVIELKINVGEANEWNTITIADDNKFGGAYALFNDQGVFWRIMTTFPGNVVSPVRCYTKDYEQTSATLTTISIMGEKFKIEGKNKCVFLDKDTVYYVLKSETFIYLKKHLFNSGMDITIYGENLNNVGYDESINLAITNATVYVQFNTNIVLESRADYYWQRLTEDTWDPVLYGTYKAFNTDALLFISKTDFNLVQLCSLYIPQTRTSLGALSDGCIIFGRDVYNPLNYNGLSYTDYNSMLPEQTIIYSNTSPVFARDILDKTIIDNKTISTVVVPNTYLNNVNITNENLLSETNSIMVSQTTPITKNIYEAVYLNFVNNITSKGILEDSGETIDLTINSDTNSYITGNINTGTEENCQDTSMGWLVVNYSDGTTMTNSITWELDNSDEYKYKYTFALDVQKEIASYEVKSYDLEQTYFTAINGEYPTQLEVGNVYTITQSVSVS